MQYEVTTLKKGLQLLDALRANGPMSLTQLVEQTGWSKTTVFRLLSTLEGMTYVTKSHKTYTITELAGRPTPRLGTIENWNMVPPLHELSQELGETVYVAILQGTEVINTQVVDGKYTNRSHTQVGDRFFVHQSALGKVILAFLEADRLQEILSLLELAARTERTFVDRQLLLYHLRDIREKGVAIDDEEADSGIRCLAVPILKEGNVVAALAISGPADRLTKKRDVQFSKVLQRYSQKITSFIQ